ncbi:MAG TPA: Crp/Fnr family transcriptional regulator [Anaerolineae bacterium]|nr:Crp/Fnr family transcriptional regulator [Anaerolineae bacterium]
MKNISEIIADISLFNGLPEKQLNEIEGIAVKKRYGKGEIIFSEGDEGNGFYVVAEGKVKIFKASIDGKEQILHIYGPENPFGEVPVFSGKKFPANAQAMLKTRLLFFPKTAFIKLITTNPSMAMNMLAVLSMRLREFTVQIENLSLKEVPGRLASYLIYLAEEQKNADNILLPISKGQLASLLGTIPETLSRIFAKMSTRDLIEINGLEIKLLDRSGLADLAEHGKLT